MVQVTALGRGVRHNRGCLELVRGWFDSTTSHQ